MISHLANLPQDLERPMELVEAWEVNEADEARVGLEAAKGGVGLDVEDLDEVREVGGGEENGVGAEGGAGDGVIRSNVNRLIG